MDEFELEPVGVREEHGIVALAVGGILGRGFNHDRSDDDETVVQGINVRATVGMPDYVKQARGIAVMRSIGLRSSGRHVVQHVRGE
jgi:hypothetical protein